MHLRAKPLALYARELAVYKGHVAAFGFGLILGNGRICVIQSDWGDTPREAIDYHMIVIASQDGPKGISRSHNVESVSADQNQREMSYPGIVHLRQPLAPVTSIQILDHKDSRASESVHYDHSLIFTRADGYRFSLSAQESIAGGLYFTDDEVMIKEEFEEFPQRMRLDVEPSLKLL